MSIQSSDNPHLKHNNFDLLRLLFASTVCLVHAYQLSGYRELAWIDALLSSLLAIKAFFVLSGYLIFMSYERSRTLAGYAEKRLRRIYPGYICVILLCAFGLAAASTLQLQDYFSFAWLRYLVANAVFLNFLQPELPGVFANNLVPEVNGALWTIKIEVMFYACVPVLVWLIRRYGCLPVLLSLYCLSLFYAFVLEQMAMQTGEAIYLDFGRQLPAQLCYFLAGGFFYYYPVVMERYRLPLLLSAVVVFVLERFWFAGLLEPFAFASVVIFCGLYLPEVNISKYGDFSYGIYIAHFPLIQLLLATQWFADRPWFFLLTTLFLVAATAILLWRLVELPFLHRSSHYVVTSQG